VVKKIAYEPHFIISAIATVVTVAEILKNNGLAVEKSKFVIAYMSVIHFLFSYLIIQPKSFAEIMTSTVDVNDDSRSRPIQKAKVGYLPVLEIN
jgi:hypothetical protein